MVFEISPPGEKAAYVQKRYKRRDSEDFAFQPGESPHDIETEKAVLAGVFLSNELISDVQQNVTVGDFYFPAHRKIFEAMLKLAFDNTPVDLTTLSNYLRDYGQLDDIGGIAYLSDIYATPSTSEHAIEYAKIVSDLSWRRRLLDASQKCRNLAIKTGDTRDIALMIERTIFEASQQKITSKMSKIGELLEDTIKEFERRVDQKDDEPVGVRTGLDDLDDCIFAFRPGQLIVLAAGPGQGKTSLATNIVCNAITKHEKTVLFFSLEMTKRELVERVLSSISGIDSGKLRKGLLDGKDFNDLFLAAEDLSGSQLYIDDRSILTPFDVLAQARRLISTLKMKGLEPKIDLIVCDYIQIMKPGGRFENRSIEVAAITGGLKAIAKDLEVPVMALSQLNRDRSKRTGSGESKKPGLSDLRDSGAIEADADIVMFIHRDPGPETDSRAPSEAEIIVGKNRAGPTKNIRVTWLGHLTKFVNYIDPTFAPVDYMGDGVQGGGGMDGPPPPPTTSNFGPPPTTGLTPDFQDDDPF